MDSNGKGRGVNERSLENLKLGAKARYQGKVRRNTTLLPETIAWLDAHGNASNLIDELVAAAKRGKLRFSNHAHNGELETLTQKLIQQEELLQRQHLEIADLKNQLWLAKASQINPLDG